MVHTAGPVPDLPRAWGLATRVGCVATVGVLPLPLFGSLSCAMATERMVRFTLQRTLEQNCTPEGKLAAKGNICREN